MKNITKKGILNLLSVATLSCFLVFSFASCNNSKKKNKEKTPNTISANKNLNAANNTDTSLMVLKKFRNQYPRDVQLLSQPELEDRLKTLLGSHYNDFRKYWQTETPILIDSNVLSTTGCEQHNCAANQYVLQIDLKHNNINVYHFGMNGIQSFLEKGPIKLPQGLAKDFQTISNNGGNAR